jgi:hypothetical protein
MTSKFDLWTMFGWLNNFWGSPLIMFFSENNILDGTHLVILQEALSKVARRTKMELCYLI